MDEKLIRSIGTKRPCREKCTPPGKKPKLNKNQQIVLDVLKKNANQGLDELIVGGITYMNDEEIDAIELTQQEELYQVLAAFAEWGTKNEKSD